MSADIMPEIKVTPIGALLCPHSQRILKWLEEKKRETGCSEISIESNCIVIEYTTSYLKTNMERVRKECSCSSCNCGWMGETLEEKSQEIHRRIETGRYHLSYRRKDVLVVRV